MRVFIASPTSPLQLSEYVEQSKPLKCKYMLNTYFEGDELCKQVCDYAGRENFLLDSGAFSYMSGAKCSQEQLIEYLYKYISFIKLNDVKYFFELDVDTIFGIDFVEHMRTILEGETGKQCIPVWHKGRGVDYWKRMVRDYDYIAIGGLVFHVKKSEYDAIKKLVRYARQRGVKVHGLGFTKTGELGNYDFYSVDSTSWKMSAIRGQQMQFFNGGRITQRPIVRGGKRVNIPQLTAHNFKEWVKYQHYMDTKGW